MPELGFFILIYDFLSDEIAIRMSELLGRATTFATSVALVLMTIWVWWQGWRLVTGQSRDSMAQFFAQSAQRVFIIAMAFGVSIGGSPLYEFLAEGLPEAINEFVTGDDRPLGSSIDDNLLKMQLAMASIDLLQTGGSEVVADAKARAQWFAGIGTGGPAIVGGTMLLMFKIAIGLFVGFGPIFILCLLFDFTKQLFSKWLFYGIGTMFALAMLSMMVEIATRMVSAVAVSMWLGDFLTNLVVGDSAGINSRAMQQGGLGLILTMMIISVPPIAAAFFNGVLGQFTPYAAFGSGAQAAPGVRGPGSPPTHLSSNERFAHRDSDDVSRQNAGSVDPRSFGVGSFGGRATGVSEIGAPPPTPLGVAREVQPVPPIAGPASTTSSSLRAHGPMQEGPLRGPRES